MYFCKPEAGCEEKPKSVRGVRDGEGRVHSWIYDGM